MVDYDVKIFVANTEENNKRLRELGLTQIGEYDPLWNNAKNWYVGVSDLYENGVADVCDPENELCRFHGRKEISEEEFNECNEDNCGVFQKIVSELKEKREVFDQLIQEVFPEGAIFIYGNKKDASDELREVFKTEDWWEALAKLEKLIDSLGIEYLQFGNDDLNGWALTKWKINKNRENFAKVKELIEEAQRIGAI